MDVRQLSYVVAVADHGGFTKAAAAMHVSQPALSQAVASLERELGAPLFDRLGRSVRLSAAGRALLPSARQAIRAVDGARAAVDAVRGVDAGRLDLVSIATLGVSPVAEFVGEFRRRHPGVTVRLSEPDDVASVARLVADGRSEVGFTELPVASDDVVATELARQEYVSVHHRSAAPGARVSVRELAALPLVTTTPGTSTRQLVDDAFERAGVVPVVAIETDLREVIAAIVRAGGGYSILPRPVAERVVAGSWSRQVTVCEVRPRIERRIGVIRRPGTLSPAGSAFLDMVLASTEG